MRPVIATVMLLGWFVVTYSGQAVAGPFALLDDCTKMAKVMATQYYNVSTICQAR